MPKRADICWASHFNSWIYALIAPGFPEHEQSSSCQLSNVSNVAVGISQVYIAYIEHAMNTSINGYLHTAALQAVGRLPPAVQRQLRRAEACIYIIDYGICKNVCAFARLWNPQTPWVKDHLEVSPLTETDTSSIHFPEYVNSHCEDSQVYCGRSVVEHIILTRSHIHTYLHVYIYI